MARNIKQYRYYGEGADKNQPFGLTYAKLVDGSVFDTPSCYPIVQLGIQTLPGTKFYLNNSIEPIIVGYTGIYELDLDNQTEIFKLTFNNTSMETVRDNPNGYLIIDVLYEDWQVDI